MGGFSFRAVLFALALAFQAVAAGGIGVAAPVDSESGLLSQHCEFAGTSGRDAPSGHHRRHHDCLLCQSCVGAAPSIAGHVPGVYLIAFREASRLRFWTPQFVFSPTPIAQAHRARAPPILS
jgi:hypothetical protein